uniref:hypothetical protein n=1 Tax=Escherichia coli TaxID=562 RepID=UPI00197F52EE
MTCVVLEQGELSAQPLKVSPRLKIGLTVLSILPGLDRSFSARLPRLLLCCRQRTRWPEAELVTNRALDRRHRVEDAEVGFVHRAHVHPLWAEPYKAIIRGTETDHGALP